MGDGDGVDMGAGVEIGVRVGLGKHPRRRVTKTTMTSSPRSRGYHFKATAFILLSRRAKIAVTIKEDSISPHNTCASRVWQGRGADTDRSPSP